MAIFSILAQPGANVQKLSETIQATYPLHHYPLGNGAWLVAARGTAKDISDRLTITDGPNSPAIVLEAASYFGRANPAIWTWIKDNWTVGSG
jgi:hypothetical protein